MQLTPRRPRRLAGAWMALLLLVLAPPALATVATPDWFVQTPTPPSKLEPGRAIELPITVYVRSDLSHRGLELGGAGDWTGLELVASSHPAKAFPGYTAETRLLRAIPGDRPGALRLGVDLDGRVEFQRFDPATSSREADDALEVTHEVARLDASRFPLATPSGLDEVQPVRAKAARTVRVRGRFLFAVDDDPTNLKGAEGATIKVKKPEIFDDTTLAVAVTDVNGDFDFTFTADGAMDFYVKAETENATAVNVGTGVFFTTYSRTWNFDDYTGSDVNLGTRVWTGNFNRALFLTTMITRAHTWVSDAGIAPLSRVHLRFPDDSRNTSWYSPVGGMEGIHLRADRAWTIATILHEYGHHFVSQRAHSIPPQYCNGLCEDVNCGHCYWCEENNAVAWSEGFPHWLAYQMNRDHRTRYGWNMANGRVDGSLHMCGEKMAFDRPMSTEGALTEFMADLVDTTVDNDPSFDTTAEDRISIRVADILHVATVDRPSDSHTFLRNMRDHIRDSALYGQQDLIDFWAAVRNCGLDEDDLVPTSHTVLTSSTHAVGVLSPSNFPAFEFSGATDDFSNVIGGYVTITPTAAYPASGGQLVEGFHDYWRTPLAPGNYFINVAAVDGAGNKSAAHISYGPIVVGTPEPIDLRPEAGTFWEAPVVLRNDTAANATFAVYPPELLPNTDTWLNLRYINDSGSGAPGVAFRTWFYIDGVNDLWFWDQDPPIIGANEVFTRNDLGPFQLSGGRHHISAWVDNGGSLSELDDTNNAVTVPVIVRPETLAPGVWTPFGPGPKPFPGREELAGSADPAVQGHRIVPTNAFAGVVLRHFDAHTSYRLRAFEPSTGPLHGFESPYDYTSGYRDIQAMVVNTQTPGHMSFDIGAYRDRDVSGSGYELRHFDSKLLVPGDVHVEHWGASETFTLLEFDVATPLTNFNVNVHANFVEGDTSPRVYVFWIDGTTPAEALNYFDGARSDDEGFARRFVPFLPAGRHALAIHRDPLFGATTYPVDLVVETSISPLPEFEMADEFPDWDASMLPRPNFDDGPTQNFPKEIVEADGVYLNLAIGNTGPVEGMIPFRVTLDGGQQPWLESAVQDVQPNDTGFYFGSTPLLLPAGRHTLSVHLDPDQQVQEYVETNNVFAQQFGVTGPVLAVGDAIQRSAPPDPNLGLDEVRVLYFAAEGGEDDARVPKTFRAPNCDGLRLQAPQQKAAGDWVAAAAMPGEQSDVDLRLHPTAPTIAEAYVEVLAESSFGPGLSEYVLVNQAFASPADYDVGVVNAGGFEAYASHAATATDLGGAGLHGPFQIGNELTLQLHSLDLGVGTWTFKIDGGAALLGATLHAPLAPDQTPYHSKSDLDGGAPGVADPQLGEPAQFSIEIRPGEEGNYCLAVWKPKADALNLSIAYTVDVSYVAGDPGPIVVDGSADGAYDLPFAVQTTQTSFGDADQGQIGLANGSELDQAFAFRDDETLYLLFAGNLESNLNDLEIFLDTRPGGQNRLRGDNVDVPDGALARMGDDGNGNGNGLRFDTAMHPDWYFSVSGGDSLPYRLFASMAELRDDGNGTAMLLGATTAGGFGRLYGPQPEVDNPFGVRVAIDNSNLGGVNAGTGQDSGAGVTTGIELAIPLVAIGDPVGCIRVCAFVNGREHDFVSNQVLGPLPPGTGNLGEPRDVDFSTLAGDQFFDVCGLEVVGIDEDLPTRPRAGIATLNAAMPNPFNPRTSLSFSLDRDVEVELSLFDARGRKVRTLATREFPAGEHQVVWNGEDDAGRPVGSGVYLVELRAGSERQTRKIALVR